MTIKNHLLYGAILLLASGSFLSHAEATAVSATAARSLISIQPIPPTGAAFARPNGHTSDRLSAAIGEKLDHSPNVHPTDRTNVFDLGFICDGVTDNGKTGATDRVNAVPSGTVFFPPASLPCMTSIALSPASQVTLFAHPGTITIKAPNFSIANPLLFRAAAKSDINIDGLAFDGNVSSLTGTSIVAATLTAPSAVIKVASTSGFVAGQPVIIGVHVYTIQGVSPGTLTLTKKVITADGTTGKPVQRATVALQVYDSSNIVFDKIKIQNTRGIGVMFSRSSKSGIRNSIINNVGNYNIGSSSALIAISHQGIDFCCGTISDNVGNFAINNHVSNTGLDSIAFADQKGILISQNHITSTNSSSASGQFAAGIWGHNNISPRVLDNVISGAMGSGMDIGGMIGGLISGNTCTFNGSAGIALTPGSLFVSVSNNVTNNNNQALHAGNGYASPYTAGIVVAGVNNAAASAFLAFAGNTSTDTQTTKTQAYGFQIARGFPYSAVWIDRSNNLAGNARGLYEGVVKKYSTLQSSVTSLDSGFAMTATPPATLLQKASSCSFAKRCWGTINLSILEHGYELERQMTIP